MSLIVVFPLVKFNAKMYMITHCDYAFYAFVFNFANLNTILRLIYTQIEMNLFVSQDTDNYGK